VVWSFFVRRACAVSGQHKIHFFLEILSKEKGNNIGKIYHIALVCAYRTSIMPYHLYVLLVTKFHFISLIINFVSAKFLIVVIR
jgi:hypothetical protein